jgi:5-formyltetrahydrofolate cyclo-ligase
MHCKSSIRRTLRQQRQQLGQRAQYARQQQLARLLTTIPALRQCRHIAGYWPNDGEISPLAAMMVFRQQGKLLYLPKIQADGYLQFHRFCSLRALYKNRYGIAEPVQQPRRRNNALDAVLMPLVAFDATGNRLGMGGGFYDRSFAFKQQQRWRKKPLLIGLAHDFQQLPQLPHDSWDIPLDMIVSNRQVFFIR